MTSQQSRRARRGLDLIDSHSSAIRMQVIGMYKTLLGADGFRKGMDLYFKRHDGQVVRRG